jgi:6,7-dimethyl-8-ribityllumazine synthase
MVAMQVFEGRICQPPPGGNITIIVARFNKTITQRLLDGALAKLRQHKVHEDDIRVVWVPGSYELPCMTEHFARDEKCMAIICLGAVIKGETSHDQHINRYVSMELGRIAARYNKTVIFGVITCDTLEQANARSGMMESEKDKAVNPAPGNKGAEAAEAALEMIDLHEEIPAYPPFGISPQEILSQFFGNDDDDDDDVDMDYFPLPPRGTKKVKKTSPKKGKGG